MPKIVECIPNFSEARRPEVVDRIAVAITSVTEVRLLDRSSDMDHNRSVLSFAGPPQAVAEAAFRAIRTAGELINMDEHNGEHPRMGATDVVPFVPISEITMGECVALARQLGRRVGTELQIPVYFYEYAATRSERVNLENVRRGQYEGLKADAGTNPDRKPDEGPSQIPTAGATAIGARDALIAFNIYLTTSDVEIAKKIAKVVRNSSGGLRYVKAMGVLVDGMAQVSMNLTNYQKTPLARVVEMVRREAQRYGTAIHHSELVGLIPQDALVDTAVWYTQLDQFQRGQVLETKLYTALEKADFLDQLANKNPTPGGGSAAAYSGAMGAALVAMVAQLSRGKKKYTTIEDEMRAVFAEAEELRSKLTRAVLEDSAAYETVMRALKQPSETEAEQADRDKAIQEATVYAAHVPLQTAKDALRVMELALKVVQVGNNNAISDGASGAAMARAALTCASINVQVNVNSLKDDAQAGTLREALKEIEAKAAAVDRALQSALAERGGLSLR